MGREEKKAEVVTVPGTTVILSEDFDGTLNRSDGTLEPNCLHAIRKAEALGVPVWIVTARDMCTTMKNVCESIKNLQGKTYQVLIESDVKLEDLSPDPGCFYCRKKDGYVEYVVTNFQGITYRDRISTDAPELKDIQLEPFNCEKLDEVFPIIFEIISKKGYILAGTALISEAIKINRISRALQDIEDDFLPRPRVFTDLDTSLPIEQQGEYYKELEKIMDFFENRAITLAKNQPELSTKQFEKILQEEIAAFVEYMQYFTCLSADYKLILVKKLDEKTISSLLLSGTGFILADDNKAYGFVDGKLLATVSADSSRSVPVEVSVSCREDVEMAAGSPSERKSGPETDQMILQISTKFRRVLTLAPLPIPRPFNFAIPDFLKEDQRMLQLVTKETQLLTERFSSDQTISHSKNHQFEGIAKKIDQESKTSASKKRKVFFHLDDSDNVNKTLGKNSMQDFTLRPCTLDSQIMVFPIPYAQQEKDQGRANQALLAATKGMVYAPKHTDKMAELDSIPTIISKAIKSLETYRGSRLARANTCGGSLTYNYGFFGYSGREKREGARKLIENLQILIKNLNREEAGKPFSFSPREKDALWQSGSELRKVMETIDLKGLLEKYKIFHPACKNVEFLKDLITHFARLNAQEKSRQEQVSMLYS